MLRFNNNTQIRYLNTTDSSDTFTDHLGVVRDVHTRGGLKWYLLPTERLWMTGELMRVHGAPYGGAFTPYTAGLAGWVPMIQTVLAF